MIGVLTYLFLKRKGCRIYSVQNAQSLTKSETAPSASEAINENTISSLPLFATSTYVRIEPRYSNRHMLWSTEPQEVPPQYLYSIPKAIVSNLGVISTIDGSIIAESAEPFTTKNQALDGFIEIAKNKYVPKGSKKIELFHGKYLLLTNKYAGNYGHFILECLPNARLAKDYTLTRNIKIVIHKTANITLRKSYFEALALTGIHEDQIVEFGGEGNIGLFEELLYPSPLTSHPRWKSIQAVNFCTHLARDVRALGEPSSTEISTSGYLYVSRGADYKRRPANEPEVIEFLRSHDFTIIYPEEMSVKEQILTFSQARIVVGILGAAMTNIAFSPQGIHVIMLTPSNVSGYFFWDLASLKKQSYYAIFCQISNNEKDYGNAEFYVNINELKEALSIALHSPEIQTH